MAYINTNWDALSRLDKLIGDRNGREYRVKTIYLNDQEVRELTGKGWEDLYKGRPYKMVLTLYDNIKIRERK